MNMGDLFLHTLIKRTIHCSTADLVCAELVRENEAMLVSTV